MPTSSRPVTERFAELYAAPVSSVTGRVELEVFGARVGATGYTTPSQADRLAALLELGPGDRLLELGSGRGWPGVRLASRSGCRLVQTDPQAAAVAEAARSARRVGVAELGAALVVDGLALPFRASTFDAVIHADVLC